MSATTSATRPASSARGCTAHAAGSAAASFSAAPFSGRPAPPPGAAAPAAAPPGRGRQPPRRRTAAAAAGCAAGRRRLRRRRRARRRGELRRELRRLLFRRTHRLHHPFLLRRRGCVRRALGGRGGRRRRCLARGHLRHADHLRRRARRRGGARRRRRRARRTRRASARSSRTSTRRTSRSGRTAQPTLCGHEWPAHCSPPCSSGYATLHASTHSVSRCENGSRLAAASGSTQPTSPSLRHGTLRSYTCRAQQSSPPGCVQQSTPPHRPARRRAAHARHHVVGRQRVEVVHVADDAGAAVRDRVERRGEMHADAHRGRGRMGERRLSACSSAKNPESISSQTSRLQNRSAREGSAQLHKGARLRHQRRSMLLGDLPARDTARSTRRRPHNCAISLCTLGELCAARHHNPRPRLLLVLDPGPAHAISGTRWWRAIRRRTRRLGPDGYELVLSLPPPASWWPQWGRAPPSCSSGIANGSGPTRASFGCARSSSRA